MIPPEDFIKNIFTTFDGSAINEFRAFLENNRGVKKWMIAADYCIHDTNRPNNAYAFTIIPYDAYPDQLKQEINASLPKDLKKTKKIDEAARDFLNHPRRFHIGFVLQGDPAVFNNGDDTPPLTVARQSVAATLAWAEEMGRSSEAIRKLKLLKQESLANRFNHKLLADLYVLSYLFAFVSVLLARERHIDIVGWFSDRDRMTTWCEGVIWNLGTETVYGIAQRLNIPFPEGMPIVAIPVLGASENPMWFDEFIRLPDYIAGILAAWDFSTNQLPMSGQNKYLRLAEDVVADSENMIVIKIRYDSVMNASRIKTSKTPPVAPVN